MSRIMSVNVGEARTVEFRGRPVSTGIFTSPVEGSVRVEGINLAAAIIEGRIRSGSI